MKIKAIYDPELDVTYVMEEESPTRTIILGWYGGEPNAEATKELIERMNSNGK